MNYLATEGRRSMANPFCRTVIFALHAVAVVLALAVGGCATPERPAERTPVIEIAESTWRQVDDDIGAASAAATDAAGFYAQTAMETWTSRIRQRAEEEFIPWYTSYWTQQWLAAKLAWHKLNDHEGQVSLSQRLTAYLEERYRDRVLTPVGKEVIDPDAVRRLATAFYIERLGRQLKDIPPRHGVPQQQFDQRLKAIPAIALGSAPARRATLYQIIHAEALARLPAYAALIDDIGQRTDGQAGAPSDINLSPVAERAADRLLSRFAISGGAGAVGAVVGGPLGMMVSAGVAGFSAITHENERAELAAQLRADLNEALDAKWRSLMDDPAHGVMAGVHHLSGQIEGSLTKIRRSSLRDNRPSPDAAASTGAADQ